MYDISKYAARSDENATQARKIVVQAQELAALNPLIAAGKIKALALDAAKVARENAELAFQLGQLLHDTENQLKNLKNELKSRGLISG